MVRPRRGELIVDVGAHIGSASVLAATAGARVVAIEGDPETCSVLRTNLELNGARRSSVIEAVVGSGDPADMTTWGRLSGMSTLRPEWLAGSRLAAFQPPRSRPVSTRSLDSLATSLPGGPIDWLLIDVEGSEEPALAGGSTTLRRTQRVIVEVSSFSDTGRLTALLGEAGLAVTGQRRQSGRTSYWRAERTGPRP